MSEKYQYLVIKTTHAASAADERHGTFTVYDVISIGGLVRGLFDWSYGREVIGRLQDARYVQDIFTAELTIEEAGDIRSGKSEPPSRVQRLRDAGMEHLI